MHKKVFRTYLKNILLPCFVFSLIAGAFTGAIVIAFKAITGKVIEFSQEIYAFLRHNPIFLLVAIVAIVIIAFILRKIHKIAPESKGGGIANAVAYLRGLVTFKWLRTLLGVLFSSLFTFLIGVPLGNEGPCVLAGATVSRGVVNAFGKKNKAWDRYVMTGGACAGFSAATNAPVSGVLFALEEAHHRLSPMLIMVAGATVSFTMITVEVLSSLLGVDTVLFPHLAPLTLQVKDLWLPLIIGVASGAFSVLYVKFFKVLRKTINKKIKNGGRTLVIILIFLLTLIFGVFSSNFISTGHHLVESILSSPATPLYALLCILLVRFILTSSSAGIALTGGTFVPTLAFGALVSACISQILIHFGVIDQYYHQVIVLLGMTACFSGMTKTPLTAITFAFEALSLSSNLLPVLIVSIISYIISEIFCPHSANDEIMEMRIEEENRGKTARLIDAVIEIKEGSFATGKQIRDILWPSNLFVLSVRKSNSIHVDEHGEKNLNPGDKLHVRYSTFDCEKTKIDLFAIVGEQEYQENAWIE